MEAGEVVVGCDCVDFDITEHWFCEFEIVVFECVAEIEHYLYDIGSACIELDAAFLSFFEVFGFAGVFEVFALSGYDGFLDVENFATFAS